jgi:hypothetical protein
MIHDTYDTRKIQRRVDWITSSQYHLEVSSLIGVAVIVAHSLVCNKHPVCILLICPICRLQLIQKSRFIITLKSWQLLNPLLDLAT